MNDNICIKYQRLSRKEVFLIVPLTLMGFVIVNGILSNLKSHLTRSIPRPQINTIEEIYRSPFPILTWTKEWKVELIDVLTNLTTHTDWNDKVIGVAGRELLYEQFYKYNKSISYLVDTTNANMMLRIQKHLKLNNYHNPKIPIIFRHFSYRVNKKFLFFERLNEILHRIQSAGLYGIWRRQHFSDLDEKIKNKNLVQLTNENVKRFEFPNFIFYGWIAGAVVLVVEIIWKKYKFSWIRKLKGVVIDKLVRS